MSSCCSETVDGAEPNTPTKVTAVVRDPYRPNTKSKMAAITNSAPAVMKGTDPCLDLETRTIVSG